MITRSNWVSPFERLYALQREIDRALTDAPDNLESSTFAPPMDVVETNDEIVCHLEVPGISRDDLDIRVEGNLVIITGEKKAQLQQGQKEGGFRSVERRYGRFERSFSLPRNLNASAVRASYDNGILTVVLPKAEESKPRRIQIDDGTTNRQLNK